MMARENRLSVLLIVVIIIIIIIHTFFAAALELPSGSPSCVVTKIPSLSS